MFDALYNLAVADDTISPDKFKVEGRPPLHNFPPHHPNQETYDKQRPTDELWWSKSPEQALAKMNVYNKVEILLRTYYA